MSGSPGPLQNEASEALSVLDSAKMSERPHFAQSMAVLPFASPHPGHCPEPALDGSRRARPVADASETSRARFMDSRLVREIGIRAWARRLQTVAWGLLLNLRL